VLLFHKGGSTEDVAAYQYVGCYTSSALEALGGGLVVSDLTSIDWCQFLCFQKG